MTLFWYVLSTYWYVPVCTIIPFLYRSVLGTYWYVPYHCQYVLNTLILYNRSRFQMQAVTPVELDKSPCSGPGLRFAGVPGSVTFSIGFGNGLAQAQH
jgi:hypothetical protein